MDFGTLVFRPRVPTSTKAPTEPETVQVAVGGDSGVVSPAIATPECTANVPITANVYVAAGPGSGHGQSSAVLPAVAGAAVSRTGQSRLSKEERTRRAIERKKAKSREKRKEKKRRKRLAAQLAASMAAMTI